MPNCQTKKIGLAWFVLIVAVFTYCFTLKIYDNENF